MSVSHPDAFRLLFAVPFIILVLVLNYRAGYRDTARLMGSMHESTVRSLYLVKSFFGGLSFVAFYVLIVASLAGISWGLTTVKEDRSGLDVVFAVDVSLSMLTGDAQPTRLARSGDLMRAVVQDLEGARFGVVAFTGSATRLLPLTEDQVAIESMLDLVGPELLSTPGTDLERAVATALESFPSDSDRHRAVVVFSDGEAHSGDASGPAREAAARGIGIFTVTVGTPEGGAVRLLDGGRAFDRDGNPVHSRAEPARMRRIAETAGGLNLDASEPGVFSRLPDALSEFEGRRDSEGFRTVSVERYRFFLGWALVMLALHVLIRSIRWRRWF